MAKAIGDGSVIDIGGDVDERELQIESLRTENRQLKRALSDAQVEAERAREDANRALSMLRRQLGPLYRALQAVFGELDAAGVDEAPASAPAAAPASAQTTNPRVAAIWESWKSKLGGGPAKIIDALLLHGEMNGQQLAIAIGVHRNSIPDMIYKLNKAGLIDKANGKFSLKALG